MYSARFQGLTEILLHSHQYTSTSEFPLPIHQALVQGSGRLIKFNFSAKQPTPTSLVKSQVPDSRVFLFTKGAIPTCTVDRTDGGLEITIFIYKLAVPAHETHTKAVSRTSNPLAP
jgi:hypothetical protein